VRPGIDHETSIHVIYNGVDLSRASALTAFNRHRIGWCGNFILRKNPALALQVLHELHRHDRNYVLHLAFVASDRITFESFQHQAASLGLTGAVHFDGKIAAADMPAWHARNGVLLSTSLHESFGYAIAEAAAAGCDIAVLDHRGANEFWPEESRFVSVIDAADKIRESRPNRWSKLIAERFSLECQVTAVRELLTAPPASLVARIEAMIAVSSTRAVGPGTSTAAAGLTPVLATQQQHPR
jgi:glycosyltransferase involved in cell wall biosynthesis